MKQLPFPWLIGLIFAATFLAYLPAVQGGFIWDDNANVTNPGLRTTAGLAHIWFEPGATEQYYPLLHSAFWLEHRLWGDNPTAYHLITLFFHASAACFLAAVLRRLLVPGASLAALIFALHPVCVESVAWISEQKNTLSTLLYLMAGLAYLHYDVNRKRGPYLLATGLFVMALLSKSVTATLPAALLVVLWWKRGRLSWRTDVRPLIPWFTAGAATGLFGAWVERHYIGAEGVSFELTAMQRALVAGRVIWFYLGKLLWPADLIFIYPRWSVSGAVAWQYLFPLGVIALVVALWLIRHRSRGPLAAILFFTGSLFPVLGFFNVYAFIFSFVTDHWQYLPGIGIITLVAAGLTRMLEKTTGAVRGVGLAFVTLLLGLLGTLTWQQCGNYRDLLTFYQAILEKNPDSWMAHNNLGLALAQTGQPREAIGHYEAALQLKPDYAKAHSNLGNLLVETGQFANAIGHFEAALKADPNNAEIQNNLGNALGSAGQPAAAIPHFWAALRAGPDSAETRGNLGTALFLTGQPAAAIQQYGAAARLAPNSAEAQRQLANALLQNDRTGEALTAYQRWMQLEPGSAEAHNLMGVALARENRMPEAQRHFEEALHLKANYPAASENLARLKALQGLLP